MSCLKFKQGKSCIKLALTNGHFELLLKRKMFVHMGEGFLRGKKRVIQVKPQREKDEFTNNYCSSNFVGQAKIKHETRPNTTLKIRLYSDFRQVPTKFIPSLLMRVFKKEKKRCNIYNFPKKRENFFGLIDTSKKVQ